MKTICFLLCLFFVQPPILTPPMPPSGGLSQSHCNTLLSLINNISDMIDQNDIAISELIDEISDLDDQIDALTEIWANELSKTPPNQNLINEYINRMFNLIQSQNELKMELSSLEIWNSMLEFMLWDYNRQYNEGGCNG